MKTAIVTTTINVPYLIEEYIKDAIKHGHKDSSCFIIIGDKKTPQKAKIYSQKISKKYKYPIYFLDIKDQIKYLKKYPELKKHLPYNSIQRRNIGIILAYEMKSEVIITIDDDNLLYTKDFIRQHGIVGQRLKIKSFKSSTGWLNICDLLIEKNNFKFYHRGFPLNQRWKKNQKIISQKIKGRVMANVGFWLDEPDIDAITRLALPIKVTGYKLKKNFALFPRTWSPFNSQNTALNWEIIPAYFLSPYIGRYDDIWASYIIVKIANYFKNLITFGYPLVIQKRNPHNFFKDFDKEREGMVLSDKFCGYLRKINLSGKTYQDCFKEIYLNLKAFINNDKELDLSQRKFLTKFLEGMLVWQKTIDRVFK